MKTIFILQNPNSNTPYEVWASEMFPSAEVITFTSAASSKKQMESEKIRSIRIEQDYNSDFLLAKIIETAEKKPPDHIFTNSEVDTFRGAALRELYNIPGLTTGSAACFRDKIKMKSMFRNAGLPAPEYLEIWSLADLDQASSSLGQYVLKPRQGRGSVGVHVIKDRLQIKELILSKPELLEDIVSGKYFAEEYISGDVYHVNAVIEGGQLLLFSASRYSSPPHHFAETNISSLMLDKDNPQYPILRNIVLTFLMKCPEFNDVRVIHLEVFLQQNNTPIIGEIACRTGGGLIKSSIQYTYGVDINQLALQLELGMQFHGEEIEPLRESTAFRLQTTPYPIVITEKRLASPDWLLFYENKENKDGSPSSSVDARAKLMIHGKNIDQLTERLETLAKVR